jgi:hypothetical protein
MAAERESFEGTQEGQIEGQEVDGCNDKWMIGTNERRSERTNERKKAARRSGRQAVKIG